MQKFLRSWARQARRHPAIMYGLPFMVFMVGGTYALASFTQIRYQNANRRNKLVRVFLPSFLDEIVHWIPLFLTQWMLAKTIYS
jgi:hypothetical protein